MKIGANPSRGNGRRAAAARVRYPMFHPSYILLLLPFIGVLWPAWYAREEPASWQYPLHIAGRTVSAYAALYAFVLNLVIAVVGTLVLDAARVARGRDETSAPDYEDEEGRAATAPVAAD